MAYITSNDYERVIYSGESDHRIRIWFNDIELEDADYFCEKLTVSSRILPNDSSKRFSLDNFISKELTLILHNVDLTTIVDKVKISLGTMVNGAYEDVPLGIFNIQDTPTTDKNKITIKLRDNAVLFDFGYNAKPLIDENGGTATKLQLLQDMCSKAGVVCNIVEFLDSETAIGIYDNTITARTYISYIAEQAGAIATINRDGELVFIYLKDLITKRIPLSIVEKYTLGEKFKISRVVYEDAIRKFEQGENTNDTLFINSANPYISDVSQLTGILELINGFEIDSLTTGKILGNPSIDPYDLIEIYDDYVMEETVIARTLANHSLTYNGAMTTNYNTEIGVEERKENVSVKGEATFKKWAKTEIDNLDGRITLTAGKVDTEVNTLNNKINGVSASFEDFKDNEYINSIANLQDQIDGAIQFWNGSEIPTINNYPANEWITEADKNNHRADIYTVIQDIDGEMKQGKSYRFDKVGNVWQWIELTDNELSAVQAIAQESLNKVNNILNTRQSVSGNSHLYLENALEHDAIEYGIDGKSYQETRSGKNLYNKYGDFDYPNGTSYQNRTTLLEDGTIKTTSNNALSSSRGIRLENLKANTNYVVSGKLISSNGSGANSIAYVRAMGYTSDWEAITQRGLTTTGEFAFTFNTGEATDFFLSLNSNGLLSGGPYEAIYDDIQIEEGTTATEYEPYGVMPSPDYPSEIESVGYENLLPSLNTTRIINGVTFTKNNDGSITINGTATKNTDYVVTNANNTTTRDKNIGVGNYVLSGLSGGSSSTYFTQIVVNDGTSTNYITLYSGEKTFEISSASKYYLYMSVRSGVTINTTFYPMLEKDTIAHSYIPYGKYGIDIKVTGKNNFDKETMTVQNLYIGDINNSSNTGKIIKPDGTGNSLFAIPCEPNTDYIISYDFQINSSIPIFRTGYIENDVLIGSTVNSLSTVANSVHTLKTSNNAKYIIVQISYAYYESVIESLQVEKGIQPTKYEEYKSNTTLIPLNEPLKSLPNGVKDKLYVQNNKLYIDRHVGSVVLDGSVGGFNETNNWYYMSMSTLNVSVNSIFLLSNYFTLRNTNNFADDITLEGICLNNSDYALATHILIRNSKFSSKGEYTNWLLENKPIVDYELATPITEELGDLSIPLFEGINNVSLVANMDTNTNITYLLKTLLSGEYFTKTETQAYVQITEDKIVSEVGTKIDGVSTIAGNNYQDLLKKFDGYTPQSDFATLENSVKQIQTDTFTKTEINTKLTDGSVTKVLTTSGTFDENGMHYEKTGAKTSSTINEKGVQVDSTTTGEELLFAGYDEEINQTIVRTENLTVRKYLVIGDNSRIEDYGNGGGVFIL